MRIASCPVITVREDTNQEVRFKRLLLPLDTTKETKDKVVSAIKIAKVFKSEIFLLSVSTLLDEIRLSYDRLEKQLEEVASQIKAAKIPVVTKMLRNENITEAVLEYADEINADLLIIMTSEENQLVDMTMGSTARKVIEQSTKPVLSIRPGYQ
ncbi:MAG: universal stress protein [Chitinophagales bacterium]|nr:universal stress protein [Chitinophagales bacterium]